MDYLNQTAPKPNKEGVVAKREAASSTPLNYPAGRYSLEGAEYSDAGSALMDYWRILVRHRFIIIGSSMMGVIVGFCVGLPMKPVYRAQTSVEVLTLNDDFMNMKQANPTTTNENNYDTSEEQTQAKLLESKALIKRVVSKLDGNAPPRRAAKRLAQTGWRGILHLSEPVPLTSRQELLRRAAASIRVHPTSRTRILEVTVDSVDPQLAMDFANTLTQEFMALSMEARWNNTQRTSEWLRRELDEARDKLRRSEDALQRYARESGLIFTDETNNVATEKLQQVQQALSTATTERIARESRYDLAQSSPPDSLADVLSDPTLRETQGKINDLKRQIADLSAVFNPEYSKIQRLQAEVESLQSAFDHSRNDILSRIKTDFQESTKKEKLLAAAYNTQAHEVTGQDEKTIQYNILKRDVDSNRQLYDTMLQQMKQASIASAMRASNVRVVDPADLPEFSVWPNFKANSALGLLAGLFLSIAIVSIREKADRTLQQPGDVKQWLELLELGTIPTAAVEGRKAIYSRTHSPVLELNKGSNRSPKLEAPIAYSADSNAVELITFQKKPSLVAEAFRSVLTSILLVGNTASRPRVLVFTSANPSDGKTTVASNLAIAAAEIRCKVLVIDADLRRPRMHQVFGVPNDGGLTDLLQGDLDEQLLAGLVRPTSVPNLHVLPAGPPTHAAAHLLYSPNLAALVAKFRDEYDMILIDTPPMLQMTDARVVSRLADGVILVARAGQTTRDALTAAVERLEEDKTNILGTILNDWNPKQSPGGYYGYYKSYYATNYYNRH